MKAIKSNSLYGSEPPTTNAVLKVDGSGSGVKLSLLNPIHGEVATNSIVLDESTFSARKKYMIFFSELYGLRMFDHDFLYKSKDTWSYMENALILGNVVANVYFHDSLDDSIFFSNNQPVSDDIEFEILNGPVRIHDWIAEQYSEVLPPAHNCNLRFELFNDVCTIDSIVALEQQVDLLTRIVQGLVAGQEKPDWSDLFFDIVDQYSVGTARTEASVIQDIQEHKHLVRARQKEYLKRKV